MDGFSDEVLKSSVGNIMKKNESNEVFLSKMERKSEIDDLVTVADPTIKYVNNNGETKIILEINDQNQNKVDTKKSKSSKIKDFCRSCFNRVFIQSFFPIKNRFINKCLIFCLIMACIWIMLYILYGKSALIGGNYFTLWVLFTTAHVIGTLLSLIKVPTLLSSLAIGLAAANLPNGIVRLDSNTSSIIRRIALGVILAKAGLSINAKVLRKLKFQILKLACIPCIVETISFSIVNKFILNMPFEWSFLLGFAVAGVSPAVIIPFMSNFQERKLGTKKGIPTLLIASASFDNIIAITGFSLMLGIAFNQGNLWWTVVKSPLQIIIGILCGILASIILSIVRVPNILSLIALRFILLFLFSLVILFGSNSLNFSGVGPLGVLCCSFIAKLIWIKIDTKNNLENLYITNEISRYFNLLWVLIFEPMLFISIGNEILFSKLDMKIIGLGVASILIGVLFRFGATYVSVCRGKLSVKEKIFISISWLPKATVQAAVGSTALDLAREQLNTENIARGTTVLNICVASIILTAPIGALLIAFLGPKLLEQETTEIEETRT